jgi:hypothetical protein
MLHWYVLRKGPSFVIAHIDHQSALLWHEGGWELGARPFKTLAEAEKQRWQEQFAQLQGLKTEVDRKAPQSERRTAKDDTEKGRR